LVLPTLRGSFLWSEGQIWASVLFYQLDFYPCSLSCQVKTPHTYYCTM
jgi:hypothetical protein